MTHRKSNYTLINTPTRIPVPGNKIIAEFLGRVNSHTAQASVARMEAPGGWTEPVQTPAFDEITILLAGQMQIQIADESVTLKAGQVLIVNQGVKVQYSNPFADTAVYWAICLPAFSPELANRSE